MTGNDVIKDIMKFQSDRLLDKQPFERYKIASNIVEEVIEMLGYQVEKKNRDKLREAFKEFVAYLHAMDVIQEADDTLETRVDALCDIAVFAIGDIMKLGVCPICALDETAKEINSRTGVVKDGRFYKDEKAKTYKANYKKCIK